MHVVVALLLSLASIGWTDSPVSSRRAPYESYEEASARNRALHGLSKIPQETEMSTAESVAKPLDQLDLSQVPEWKSYDQVLEAFTALRDERFLKDPSDSENKRRSTWFYPDDGCYARSELIVRRTEERVDENLVPLKVFAFGKLDVKTANHPAGEVGWWYHVVPIVMAKSEAYVFDPAIDPRAPMPLKAWAQAMGEDVSTMTFSICKAHTYEPYDSCSNPKVRTLRTVTSHQRSFLDYERERLLDLKLDPEKELGDSPDWERGLETVL